MATKKKATKTAKTAHGWVLGRSYLIRTVTHYIVGRLVAVSPHELWLEDAAWVADTGRFAQALESGALSEVEPFPAGAVAVGRGAIADACAWPHALPRSVK